MQKSLRQNQEKVVAVVAVVVAAAVELVVVEEVVDWRALSVVLLVREP